MAPYLGPEPFLYLRRQAGYRRPLDPMGVGLSEGGDPPWAMKFWRDYAAGRGSPELGFPPGVDTHSGPINAPNSSGLYSSFGTNVPVMTDLGLQTVPTRTELQVRSGTPFTNGSLYEGATRSALAGTYLGIYVDAATVATGGLTNASLGFGGSVVLTNGTAYAGFVIYTAGTSPNAAVNMYGVTSANWSQLAGPVGNLSAVASLSGTWSSVVNTNLGGGLYRVDFVWTPSSSQSYILAGGPGSTVAGQNVGIIGGSLQAGTFSVPPILTTGSSATVNGNQQVISGLGTQLATGVAGFFQVNIMQPVEANRVIFTIGDASTTQRIQFNSNGANLQCGVYGSGGAGLAFPNVGAWQTGVQTIAFCLANGYVGVRRVGDSAATSAPASYPVMDRVSLGGKGSTASDNTYEFTRKLALDYLASGDDPATAFANTYSKAMLAA